MVRSGGEWSRLGGEQDKSFRERVDRVRREKIGLGGGRSGWGDNRSG